MAKTTAEALVSVSGRLRQQAEHIETAIAREKRRTAGRHQGLKAEPNPDEERIAALERALTELTKQCARRRKRSGTSQGQDRREQPTDRTHARQLEVDAAALRVVQPGCAAGVENPSSPLRKPAAPPPWQPLAVAHGEHRPAKYPAAPRGSR
jgi:hypothetical protein